MPMGASRRTNRYLLKLKRANVATTAPQQNKVGPICSTKDRDRERERERDPLPSRDCLRSSDGAGSILLHGLRERFHLLQPPRRLRSNGLGRLLLLHRLSERLRVVVEVVVVVEVMVVVVSGWVVVVVVLVMVVVWRERNY